MQLRPRGQLTELSIREGQLEKIWVPIPVGGEDDSPSVWSERVVQEVQVVVDGGVLRKLMNDCASLVIAQALVFGRPAISFSWHSGRPLFVLLAALVRNCEDGPNLPWQTSGRQASCASESISA